jgi:hypothetical protein
MTDKRVVVAGHDGIAGKGPNNYIIGRRRNAHTRLVAYENVVESGRDGLTSGVANRDITRGRGPVLESLMTEHSVMNAREQAS